ncbi:glycine zipper 2TM domain-containing protein [Luteimonas vadosa]|uniref:Glycine zipper 2TM domain-containing protein n=1 Tax=Luteimonas vadosa TaxID=1165507 RepID=A0ABP9DWJ9_9GAMM
MKRLSASILALGLAAAVGTASAQSGYHNYQPTVDRYGQAYGAQYDYARVVRVDPVFDSRSGYGTPTAGQRCYSRQDGYYAGSDPYNDRNYGRDDGYYGSGTYGRSDGYYGNDPYRRDAGSQTGRTVATVVGGLVGAVVGSKVGGGSARYATSALGSVVGGMAGREIYEASQRNRYPRQGNVTVCDPVPVGSGGGYYPANDGYGGGVRAYDVTYEYAGRRYTTRTNYHPGDRIRVRVDVRPE